MSVFLVTSNAVYSAEWKCLGMNRLCTTHVVITVFYGHLKLFSLKIKQDLLDQSMPPWAFRENQKWWYIDTLKITFSLWWNSKFSSKCLCWKSQVAEKVFLKIIEKICSFGHQHLESSELVLKPVYSVSRNLFVPQKSLLW